MLAISPSETRIGWIGTGVMGRAMCGHLLDAGYHVTLFNRSPQKAAELLGKGAEWADSPAHVADSSDVIFSIVGYPADVREIYLEDAGIVAAAQPGSVLIDMTTSQPQLAQEIAAAATERGLFAIDAPVSGGDVGAREARLSIMIGGDAAAVEALRPLFDCLGKTIIYQGPAGSGQHTKMVNQTLIASGMIGVCEALLYAHRAGLDIETVLKSVSSGAAGSWSLSNLAPRMLQQDFAPGFYVEHFLKDMGIALEEASRLQLALPGLALAKQLYEALRAQGHGQAGTQALVLALAKLNAVDWQNR
ncbi:NAD(P)-dependent oxidoreductase [Planctomycetaceae bacterium SH139]